MKKFQTIRKLITIEQRTLFLIVMIGFASFLWSVLVLVALIIADRELEFERDRGNQPVRVEQEVLLVADYRCKGDLNYVLVPRKGETYHFICNNGDWFRDTITLTAAPGDQSEEIDYALD